MVEKVLAQARTVTVPTSDIGFTPPTFETILTFFIRGILVIAGIAALLYLLLGALSWVTSGGDKEKVEKAQQKIQAAVVGIIIVFVVLSLAVLLEQIVFPANCGLGLTKPICFPTLVD